MKIPIISDYLEKRKAKEVQLAFEAEKRDILKSLDSIDINSTSTDDVLTIFNKSLQRAGQFSDKEFSEKVLHKINYKQNAISLNVNRKGRNEDSFLLNTSFLGDYKEHSTGYNWNTLRKISRYPIVRACHNVIISAISKFAKPRADKYSYGFFFEKIDGSPISKNEQANEIAWLERFIRNCGKQRSEVRGNFEEFVRRFTQDSLTFDHPPYEIIWNLNGEIDSFANLAAETIKVANTYFDNYKDKDAKEDNEKNTINGYYPSYVQVLQGGVVAEFYEWELACPKRNPESSIESNGYGRSELEDLIPIVNSIALAINYNCNQFTDGIPANTLLWFKNGNRSALEEFKKQIRAFQNDLNAGSILSVGGEEKPEVIDIRKNNKDMEYMSFLSFLISEVCSLYHLLPEMVGFRGLMQANVNYESQVNDKMKTYLSWACEPILNLLQESLNHKIMPYLLDGKYKICFTEFSIETINEKLDRMIKAVSVVPINSLLKEMDFAKTDLPDTAILNSQYIQLLQMQQQGSEPQKDSGNEDLAPLKELQSDKSKSIKEERDLFKSYLDSSLDNFLKDIEND